VTPFPVVGDFVYPEKIGNKDANWNRSPNNLRRNANCFRPKLSDVSTDDQKRPKIKPGKKLSNVNAGNERSIDYG
jgi:hypothetical protein